MRTIRTILITAIVASILSACGASQPGADSSADGYYQQRINTNTYRIAYTGNNFTSKEDVYDLSVLRAAELGKKLGYRYFLINDTHNASPVGTDNTGTRTATNATVDAAEPAIGLKIEYYQNPPAQHDGHVYEVDETTAMLKAKHRLN